MLTIKEISINGFERVIEGKDPARGLHCFIAVHNTSLGPSLGGARIHRYSNPDEALQDALRLARAMTYKSAVVEDGLGGGKSVIIADPKTEKTRDLLLAFGETVDYLKGLYIAAEDVGSCLEDMLIIRERTPFVAALPTDFSSGDPSRFTAHGVYSGILAVAQKLWNSTSLKGKTIAIQGLGNVGMKLADILFWEEVNLVACDVDPHKTRDASRNCGVKIVSPLDFTSIECDIFAPCALGNVLTPSSVAALKCKAVAGGANNQLETPEVGQLLFNKGILYAPDFIINSGGIINAAAEFEPHGYNPLFARDKVHKIFDTLLRVFEKSEKEGKSTNQIADEIAEFNIQQGIGKRQLPIPFKELK